MGDRLNPDDLQHRKSTKSIKSIKSTKSAKSVRSVRSTATNKSGHSDKTNASDEDYEDYPEASEDSIHDNTEFVTADAGCIDCDKEEKLVTQRGRLIIILSVVLVVLLAVNGALLGLFLGCGGKGNVCRVYAWDTVDIILGPNLTADQATLDISDSVEYRCKTGYKKASGNEKQICTAPDTLSGSPLKCIPRVIGDNCDALDDCLYVSDHRECEDCCYQKNQTCIKACPGPGEPEGWHHAETNKCWHFWPEAFPELANKTETRLSFAEAKEYCKNLTSYLPLPTSVDETLEVANVSQTANFFLKGFPWIYIGIAQDPGRLKDPNRKFKYFINNDTNRQTNFTYFNEGEPSKDKTEHCIVLSTKDDKKAGRWADTACVSKKYKRNFMCVKYDY